MEEEEKTLPRASSSPDENLTIALNLLRKKNNLSLPIVVVLLRTNFLSKSQKNSVFQCLARKKSFGGGKIPVLDV